MTNYDRFDPQRYVRHAEPERMIDCMPSEAIQASAAALDDLGFDILSQGEDPYFVRSMSRGVSVPEFCDCGPPIKRPLRGEADAVFVVTVDAQPGGVSKLSVDNDCSWPMSDGTWFRCASGGFIELDFFERFRYHASLACSVDDPARDAR